MSISVECPYCRTLNSTANRECSACAKKIPPLNKKYWIRYRIDGKSKKECLGVVPFKEAVEIERQRLVELPKRSKAGELRWSDVTGKFVAKLIAEQKNHNYVNDSKRYLRRLTDFMDNPTIDKITPLRIREFQVDLRSSGLSESSCDRHLQACKAAWNYCVEDLKNPFARVKLYNPDNVTERFLTEDQRTRLLVEAMKINQKLYEMLIVTLSTGFRKDSVLKLRRSEVDFESGVISIRQKGNLSHTAYLNDLCMSVLMAIPDNGTDYFWVSSKTNLPYRNDWRNAWEKARRRAGISDDFRWHDLRHDVGTAVYAATHDLQAVQRYLGHRQMKTTQRYAHTNPQYLKEISDRLGIGLSACPTRVPTIIKRKKTDKIER